MSFPVRYPSADSLPRCIPVFPLSGALLLPRAQLPLNIFEPRYLAMVDDALSGDRIIGIVQPEDTPNTAPKSSRSSIATPSLFRTGCAGRLTAYTETSDDRMLITLTGIARFRIASEYPATRPYRSVEPDYAAFADDFVSNLGEEQVDRPALLKAFRDFLDAHNMGADWDEVAQATSESLVNAFSILSPFSPIEKQALLEAADLKARAEMLIALTEISLGAQAGGMGSQLQ
jgi:Lon protease-like protein